MYALDYSLDGKQFASAGKDYTVRVYDEATKACAKVLWWVWQAARGPLNRIFALKFTPDDPKMLLSAGWDNTVRAPGTQERFVGGTNLRQRRW